MEIWTHHSHLKNFLAYSWELRWELVGLGDWDCFSTTGVKECWLCPKEFGQVTPEHRSEPVFLFWLFMGTSPSSSCAGVFLLCMWCCDRWAVTWRTHLSRPHWEPSEGSLFLSLPPFTELPRGLVVCDKTRVKYVCVISTQHSKENITFALKELPVEGRRETYKGYRAVHYELRWKQAVRWCWKPISGLELRK